MTTQTPNTQILTTVIFSEDVRGQHDLIRMFINDYFASSAFEEIAAHQALDQKLVNNMAIGLTAHVQKMYDLDELFQKVMITSINVSGSQPENSIDNIMHVKIEVSGQ